MVKANGLLKIGFHSRENNGHWSWKGWVLKINYCRSNERCDVFRKSNLIKSAMSKYQIPHINLDPENMILCYTKAETLITRWSTVQVSNLKITPITMIMNTHDSGNSFIEQWPPRRRNCWVCRYWRCPIEWNVSATRGKISFSSVVIVFRTCRILLAARIIYSPREILFNPLLSSNCSLFQQERNVDHPPLTQLLTNIRNQQEQNFKLHRYL